MRVFYLYRNFWPKQRRYIIMRFVSDRVKVDALEHCLSMAAVGELEKANEF